MKLFNIKKEENKKQALEVWKMFLIPGIIGPFSKGEKIQCKKDILNTLNNPHGAFFYVKEEGIIVGSIGAWENNVANGGFVIERFAVGKEYRGKGIGKELFLKAEEFIKKFKPRYITIETGDDKFYKKGIKIYKKNGYKKVSHFPKYYSPRSGRVDYMKTLR